MAETMNEDNIDNRNEPHENHPLNPDEETPDLNSPNRDDPGACSRPVWLHRINLGLKLFFVALALARFVALISFLSYDVQCMIVEHASVIDCSQDSPFGSPQAWILSWILMSIVSSTFFSYFFLKNPSTCFVGFQWTKASKAYKKGSFISLIILGLITLIYYSLRIKGCTGIGCATSSFFLIWPFSIVFIVWGLNYLPGVQWKKLDESSCSSCCCSCCCCCWPCGEQWRKECRENLDFFIYWLALIMYFLEITFKLGAVMADLAYNVAPLIQQSFPEKSEDLRGYLIILQGFRLAFHKTLLSFFWHKIFHGDKDFLSEPCAKLIDDQQDAHPKICEKTNRKDIQEVKLPLKKSEAHPGNERENKSAAGEGIGCTSRK